MYKTQKTKKNLWSLGPAIALVIINSFDHDNMADIIPIKIINIEYKQ